MAHLSDDDVPTMSGTPGSIEDPDDQGDTTSADLSAPVSTAISAAAAGAAPHGAPPPPDDDPAGHEEEDRTVQQKVATPGLARRSSPGVRTEPSPAGPPTVASPTSPPIAPPVATARSPGAAKTEPFPTGVDADELEDSVTATAPRVPANLKITVPGAVEIRTLDDDADETEVKTLTNLSPELQIALNRVPADTPHNAPQRSQPPPPPRPAAGAPPPSSEAVAAGAPLATTMVAPVTELDSDELAPDSEEVLPADEEFVTTQSLAPRVGSMADTDLPTASGISDAPKVAPTDPMGGAAASSSEPETSKTGGAAPAIAADAEADEPATRPGLGGESQDDPPTRPGLEAPTRPGLGDPPTHPRKGDIPTAPTSKLVRPTAATERDDSITTQAPNVPPAMIAAAIAQSGAPVAADDDSTDGTTARVKRVKTESKPAIASGGESPADGEAESITTQAPGPLTNMLRVIAADRPSAPEAPIEEEEPEENRTAVMANAPLIRAAERSNGVSVPTQLGIGPRAVAAPQLNPTSESGLRVARPGSGSGERVSVGALSPVDPRISGIAPAAMPSESLRLHGISRASTELAFPPGSGPQPSVHDVDLGKGPRYGLLVGIVAVISFVVPVTLFFLLRGDGEVKPVLPNEPAADFQKHDGPRSKAEKGKREVAPAPVAPSASAPSKPPPRFPFRR